VKIPRGKDASSVKTGRPFVRALLYLACFSVTFLASARTGWTQNYTGMVSFGDSLSDLGNTVATLSAFGEPFVRGQTGYNANFYFNGRFSNGPL
jgi:phospholipase/lecithinase/hemolysin